MIIPIGTLCRIIDNGSTYAEYVGLECTVMGDLAMRGSTCKDGTTVEAEVYEVHIQGFGTKQFNAPPSILRVLRYPDGLASWLRERMDGLLSPNHVIALELALENAKEGGQ